MVRENRIKIYRFNPENLVGGADSLLNTYTAYPLNGLIQSIQYTENNFVGTGSIYLRASGTGEIIWSIPSSGTGIGNIAGSDVVFPRASTKGTDNSNQSGLNYAEIPVNTILQLDGSIGVSKSGTGFNIIYI